MQNKSVLKENMYWVIWTCNAISAALRSSDNLFQSLSTPLKRPEDLRLHADSKGIKNLAAGHVIMF